VREDAAPAARELGVAIFQPRRRAAVRRHGSLELYRSMSPAIFGTRKMKRII
jgi:hypothetical protein